MASLRIRVSGVDDRILAIKDAIEGMEGVERMEEVGDLMNGMRDDSSSAGLNDDSVGRSHAIEVQTTNEKSRDPVHQQIEQQAMRLGLVVEFVDRF